MASSQAPRTSVSRLTDIAEMYVIPLAQENAIQRFLQEHDFLRPILLEAKDRIIPVFGSDVKLCLELEHDPEEGWDELFIVIKSKCSAEEAIRLEKRVMDEWFLDRMMHTKGKLNVAEEPL